LGNIFLLRFLLLYWVLLPSPILHCGVRFAWCRLFFTDFHLHFVWCRFLFSLVLVCIFMFTSFVRVHLAPFLASSTFVWRVQALWLSQLNAWFDNPCCFSLQEVNNFVKFIKNSYKFIFDPNFLSTTWFSVYLMVEFLYCINLS